MGLCGRLTELPVAIAELAVPDVMLTKEVGIIEDGTLSKAVVVTTHDTGGRVGQFRIATDAVCSHATLVTGFPLTLGDFNSTHVGHSIVKIACVFRGRII